MTSKIRIVGTCVFAGLCLTSGFVLGVYWPVFKTQLQLNTFAETATKDEIEQRARDIIKCTYSTSPMRVMLFDFLASEYTNLTVTHWRSLLSASVSMNDSSLIDSLLAEADAAEADIVMLARPLKTELDGLPLSDQLAILTWMDYDAREAVEQPRQVFAMSIKEQFALLLDHNE